MLTTPLCAPALTAAEQEEVLRAQLAIAKELQRPISVRHAAACSPNGA